LQPVSLRTVPPPLLLCVVCQALYGDLSVMQQLPCLLFGGSLVLRLEREAASCVVRCQPFLAIQRSLKRKKALAMTQRESKNVRGKTYLCFIICFDVRSLIQSAPFLRRTNAPQQQLPPVRHSKGQGRT